MGPQIENGYTRIANEILEALARVRIPGEQRQCLDVIFRKTYGYGKKLDSISNSQFCEATGLKKGNASRAVKALVDKNIVIKNDNGRIPTYQFNKNFSKWRELSKKQPVIKKTTAVIKSDNELLSKVMDTKERKKTLQKKEKPFLHPDECSSPKDSKFYLTKKKKKLTGKRLETFDLFWEAFDYRKGKAEAADAWLNIPTLTDQIVQEIIKAARSEAQRRPGILADGRTPKMAQGWLTGRRWEDEEFERTGTDSNWRGDF